MTDYVVSPSSLSGEIKAPPSKSHTLRAILFASMAQGQSLISDWLPSPDARAMINACRQLGAEIEEQAEYLKITGVGGKFRTPDDVIDAGNSGQVLRFIAAIGSLLNNYIVITGDHSVRHNRPIWPLLEALPQLGVFCATTKGDGYAPLIVKGPMQAGETELSGIDSQPVSGLLMAALLTEGDTVIKVRDPGEKPWINLTLDWFRRLNLPYQNDNFTHYVIPGPNIPQAFEYQVSGDFSSILFPVVAAIITNSEIKISNVDMDDSQGDKAALGVLQKMGANLEIDLAARTLSVKKNSSLLGMEIDINDFIDSITILAVAACYAHGKTRLLGASIARQKECDRIIAIATELKKMGAVIEELPDGLEIQGSNLHGWMDLHTYHDHRMAMSLAVAALGADGPSCIKDVAWVAKSYPDFYQHMRTLGCAIELA